MTETWNIIPGLGGRYAASSLGRIKRSSSGRGATNGRILLGSVRDDGRRRVGITIDGRYVGKTIARLVALAFIGPCPEGWTVNHIDGDKGNDRPENLEYLTTQDNTAHAVKMGLHTFGSRNGNAILNDSKVLEIKSLCASGIPHELIGNNFGVSRSTIGLIASGKRWKHLAAHDAQRGEGK